MNFTDLGLSEKTIKAINEAGIMAPTTVQADVIPSVLEGKDVFAIAPAGCGKTCSYVFPLIDIISQKKANNILIVTANSKQSVAVSDRFAVFNKYHEVSESTLTDENEDINSEANVVIASPDLLLDLINEDKLSLDETDILVVDDINLIKKLHQLRNLEKILELLPTDKQNIIFTNRRSRETQDILDKILKTPAEIKVNKNKEAEAVNSETFDEERALVMAEAKSKDGRKALKKNNLSANLAYDAEAVGLMEKFHTFGRKTPEYLLINAKLADDEA